MYLKKMNEWKIKKAAEEIKRLSRLETCGLREDIKQAINESAWIFGMPAYATLIECALMERKTQYLSEKQRNIIIKNAMQIIDGASKEMDFIHNEDDREKAQLWAKWFDVEAKKILVAVSADEPKEQHTTTDEQPVAPNTDAITQAAADHAENDARIKAKRAVFMAKQKLPYEAKIQHAEIRAREFYDKVRSEGKNCHVSVGGLDSITLLLFLREIGINVPAISVSTLEDKSIQEIHEQLGVEVIKPYKAKVEVLRECGYPVISKEKAGKISMLQHPRPENATVRHAIMTGDCGKQGGYRTGTRMRLPQKWLNLFGGPENERYGTDYKTAPFQVSNKCCYYMKEKPCDDWAKKHKSYPYLGMMASEGGQREKALMISGCNYYGKTTTRSCPFAIFNRQDILQLALDLNVPIPAIYGTIERREDGTLYTTRAQRTGCSMCGFGIHIENRPHRFDRLREDNPKEWAFWMYDMGWGEVLTYIGVGWEDIPQCQNNT